MAVKEFTTNLPAQMELPTLAISLPPVNFDSQK
jgi:hypothetical protein